MGSFSLSSHIQSVHASKLQSSSNSVFCFHSNTNTKRLCFLNKTSNSKIKLTVCLSSPKDAASANNPPGDGNIPRSGSLVLPFFFFQQIIFLIICQLQLYVDTAVICYLYTTGSWVIADNFAHPSTCTLNCN